MKLRPAKRTVTPVQPPEEPKKTPRKKSENTLPTDTYKPLYEPFRFLVSDKPSHKDPEQRVKYYLEVSVKRSDDELGLPMCYISTYQESPFYTGYLKGKNICLPITEIASLVEVLSDTEDQCARDNLMDEFSK